MVCFFFFQLVFVADNFSIMGDINNKPERIKKKISELKIVIDLSKEKKKHTKTMATKTQGKNSVC